MADDKKKKGAGKFLKVLAGVLFVVIVVVAIIIFVPSNKKSLVDSLVEAKQTMLLGESKATVGYDTFSARVNANSRVKIYENEMASVKDVAYSVNEVVDYYNDFIKFAKNNQIFKNNNGAVKSALASAEKASKEMENIIAEAVKLTDSKETYLRNTWLEYRKSFSSWLVSYKTAFEKLSKIFSGCFGETIAVNTASKINMNTVVSYMKTLCEKVDDLVQNDKAHTEISDYQFTYGGIAENFKKFVDANVKLTSESENYFYDNLIQSKYSQIVEFTKTEKLENLISTIDSTGAFPEVENKTEQQKLVEKYLGGN